MRNLIINLDYNQRIIVYPEGGSQLQTRISGDIGWVEDNESMSDSEFAEHLRVAAEHLKQVAWNARYEGK